jgi:spore coat polysaccharide biosynthesis protein SpsF
VRTGVSRDPVRTVLCWVDAGPAFGLGHVSRTLALAEALAERSTLCRFALAPDPTALAWIAAAGMPAPLLLPDETPLPAVLAAAREVDAVIVDVKRPLDASEVRALGGSCPVLVVDNPGDGVAEADLVLAPVVGVGRGPRWLGGPEHVPLRRVFRTPRDAQRTIGPPVVLVTMGASDPGGLTVPVVDALARARADVDLTVRVLANPAAPVWGALGPVLARHGFAPPVAVEPARTAELLAAADVAVVAMGVTVYEALASGVPPVVLCRTSGDAAHARTLAARGAVEQLGVYWTEERVAETVARLVAAPDLRVAMAARGRALVDGRAAERVAGRLLDLLSGTEVAHAGAVDH